MEDALVLKKFIVRITEESSLNPCFNGRCTRTFDTKRDARVFFGLNPCFNGRCTRTVAFPEETRFKGVS